MGSSGSKDKGKKGSGGDDGCIGNRRVRTIILSLIIGVFFLLAIPVAQGLEELYRDLADLLCLLPGEACDEATDGANAWAIIMTGAIVSLVGCIAAVLLFLIPNCDDTMGRVAGFILIVGGVLYMIGWIWWVSIINPDPSTQQSDARMLALVGEALLAGGSAILLGLDALLQIYENEAYRLASNLGIIGLVSALCINAYFLQICTDDEEVAGIATCITPDGVEAIASGYLILFWTTLVYIILYIFTCCTCNCKDNCLVRVVIAVALVVGGLLTAIGYWVYSGADEDTTIGDDASIFDKQVVYYVGYTILIGGLCCVWALDIALDDVKNNSSKK